jgi:hypothetical protein
MKEYDEIKSHKSIKIDVKFYVILLSFVLALVLIHLLHISNHNFVILFSRA